jgi:beta-lactamase regulating signal transducer with metallopeptidase domain
MIGDALSRLATAAAMAAPSAAAGIIRCLAILLVSMAMSKLVRSAKVAHCLLAIGIISMPLVFMLSFTPGIELAVLPSRASAAPTLREVLAQTFQTVVPDPPEIADIAGSTVDIGADKRLAPLAAAPLISLLAWLTGWGIVTVRQVAGHVAAAAILKAAGQAPPPDVRGLAEEGREWFGIARPVRIAIDGSNRVPFTRGTLRPVICLPTCLLELSPQRIKLIVLHELAHVRRFDTFVAAAARFACALFWFLPPVWIAVKWLDRVRETACDDVVLAIASDASGYATTLVLTARAARMPVRSAVTSGAAPLESRIRNILRPRAGKEHVMKSWHRALIATSVIALATTALLRCAPTATPIEAVNTIRSTNTVAEMLPVFTWPLEDQRGSITAYFGVDISPVTGRSYIHRGLDIAWAPGLPVIAAADGTVVKIGVNDRVGIFLMHAGGFSTLYEHLDGTSTFIGDVVQRGQVIGRLGNTGLSTGPHLQFSLFNGSDFVDPLGYLTGVPSSALRRFSGS